MTVSFILAGIALVVCLAMLPFAKRMTHRTRAVLISIVFSTLSLAWFAYLASAYADGYVPNLRRRSSTLINIASHPNEALGALILHVGLGIFILFAGFYLAWHYYKLHRAERP